MRQLLLATTNAGKVLELKAMLAHLPIEVVDLSAIADIVEVEETETTFAGNAALKASGYARQTGLWTIADDSGLEIDVLGGRPGVLSARYGGEDTDFDTKMRLILAELKEIQRSQRTARFVCSIAIADPTGEIAHTSIGKCEGTIAVTGRGEQGFGYDPIFVPEGGERTFGEMSEPEKRLLSHRGRAFSQIMPFLCGFSGIST